RGILRSVPDGVERQQGSNTRRRILSVAPPRERAALRRLGDHSAPDKAMQGWTVRSRYRDCGAGPIRIRKPPRRLALWSDTGLQDSVVAEACRDFYRLRLSKEGPHRSRFCFVPL